MVCYRKIANPFSFCINFKEQMIAKTNKKLLKVFVFKTVGTEFAQETNARCSWDFCFQTARNPMLKYPVLLRKIGGSSFLVFRILFYALPQLLSCVVLVF